jgi:hypothetical protein
VAHPVFACRLTTADIGRRFLSEIRDALVSRGREILPFFSAFSRDGELLPRLNRGETGFSWLRCGSDLRFPGEYGNFVRELLRRVSLSSQSRPPGDSPVFRGPFFAARFSRRIERSGNESRFSP